MADVAGTCAPAFETVRDAVTANLDQGKDLGASAAVTIGGELVADVWGGHVDEARTTPWAEDTIVNVWSTTKTMAALSLLLLVDAGEVDVDEPVATYWPEFAANGKEQVLVRHILSHTAGLSGWEEPMAPADVYDWERCTSLLAAQAPWWEPGTASGYHAITQGYLVGEVVRRVSGESIGTFFRRRLAEPLGADFHIGLPPEHDGRVALVVPPATSTVAAGAPGLSGIARKTFANPPLSAPQSWEVAWRRAEIPAGGGTGNARSVAQVQSVLACGGEVHGRRFLSPQTCDLVFREQCDGIDLVLGSPLRHGIGYGLAPRGTGGRSCYWGGWGGSLVYIDLDAGMTVAFVMNKMAGGTVGDDRAQSVVAAAYSGLAAAS